MKEKTIFNILIIMAFGITGVSLLSSFMPSDSKSIDNQTHPKIVNIINFIRLLEPRDPKITEDVLFQTVVRQVEIMNKYHLGGTFLLQYDALMDPRYQKLLKELPAGTFEIGAWWELPQPLIEKAGLKWRGRYPWDWHADVGFTTGYTPGEREKIADVYMNDFKKIFGYYPKSVGSWFIDAHTLNYLYEKYKIVASCNCKDQVGTDGYTMWGGYWNQAYYPSKINSYMPAQNAKNQIPVPIFRMLGSDPIRQYDHGLGSNVQGVISLEPVYKNAGGSSKWVNWYFDQFVEGESLEYGYVQAGQENSFTWDGMSKGYEIQMPLIARLRDENKVRVETLTQSGQWFTKKFKTTPATSVTVTKDLEGGNLKTVWFNSRFYRVNLLWENGTLRFRDIHLFNENFPSIYETQKATSNECAFFTLPFVDGYLWSTKKQIVGLRFKEIVNGKERLLEGGDPKIKQTGQGKLSISWPLKFYANIFEIDIDERGMKIRLTGKQSVNWFLDLNTADNIKPHFTIVNPQGLVCEFEDMKYLISVPVGVFSKPENGAVLRISPKINALNFYFSTGFGYN